MKAWSALKYSAEMCMGVKGKTVLVLGASGGVGIFAVQLLKNWGSTVCNHARLLYFVTQIYKLFIFILINQFARLYQLVLRMPYNMYRK